MYYLKIKTSFNLIELTIDNFYDEEIQTLIQQPYVQEIYLRRVNEKDYKENHEYQKTKRLGKEK